MENMILPDVLGTYSYPIDEKIKRLSDGLEKARHHFLTMQSALNDPNSPRHAIAEMAKHGVDIVNTTLKGDE